MKIALLGSGFIARFYAESLLAQRRKDTIHMVYSLDEKNAQRLANDYTIPSFTTDMVEAIEHPQTDVVLIALPNHLHELAVMAAAKAGKNVLCTKPLGRTAAEAKRMLQVVEQAGIFAGYLEDLCYTPKFLKSL